MELTSHSHSNKSETFLSYLLPQSITSDGDGSCLQSYCVIIGINSMINRSSPQVYIPSKITKSYSKKSKRKVSVETTWWNIPDIRSSFASGHKMVLKGKPLLFTQSYRLTCSEHMLHNRSFSYLVIRLIRLMQWTVTIRTFFVFLSIAALG